MNTNYTVLLDMDGVLSDFDKGIFDITGKNTHEISKKEMWKIIKVQNVKNNFFENLEVKDGANELVAFVIANFNSVGVLTATGRTPADSKDQKISWINKYFPLLSHNILIVMDGNQKARHATNTTILIDDREVCTIPFIKAGGIGILHTSINMTINILGTLLDG